MPGGHYELPKNFSQQTYSLPPATKSYVPNPNIVSGGALPGVMVELGKALLKSAEDGDTHEVKNLIGRGAPMTADWLDTSPLHKAALRGHTKMCKLLLSSGCSRDARTKVEKTALHLAASGGHSNVIELLLMANAEVNPKDMLDMSPLHWAVESGDINCVELLLRHGADVEIISKFDKTPLEIASDKQHTDIYEMLLNAESYRSLPALDSEAAIQSILPGFDTQNEVVDDMNAALLNEAVTIEPTVPAIPKMQTVQIKQEGSLIPKIIQLNGKSTAGSLISTSGSIPGQQRVIKLSSSQLNNLNLKSANTGTFKGQKVMIVSGGANKVTNTATLASATTPLSNQTIKIVNKNATSTPVSMPSKINLSDKSIKIVQVGNQPRSTISIMPNTTSKVQQTSALTKNTSLNISKNSSTISSSGHSTGSTANATTINTKDSLKRKLEEMEEEVERDRLAMEEKMALIKKWKSEIKAQNEMEETVNVENILLNDGSTKAVMKVPKIQIENTVNIENEINLENSPIKQIVMPTSTESIPVLNMPNVVSKKPKIQSMNIGNEINIETSTENLPVLSMPELF